MRTMLCRSMSDTSTGNKMEGTGEESHQNQQIQTKDPKPMTTKMNWQTSAPRGSPNKMPMPLVM